MKALSVLQPWALLLVSGVKTVENRTWYLGYRGPLLIHAGKSKRLMTDELFENLADALFTAEPFPHDHMELGAIVGRVEVVDCLKPTQIWNRADRGWAEGPWCIICRNAERFETPIPFRGQLRLFEVKMEIP